MRVQSVSSDAELQSIKSASSNANKLVVVEFMASWCGACKKIKPIVHALSNKYCSKTVFVEVDADRAKSLTQQYEVKGMPTFIFFMKGIKVEEFSGAQAEVLSSTIERLIKQCSPFESRTGFTLGGSSRPKDLTTSNITFGHTKSQRINPWADPKFVPPYSRGGTQQLLKNKYTASCIEKSLLTSTMNSSSDEDEDLAKAIALSLTDSRNNTGKNVSSGQQLNDSALTKNLDQSLVTELINMGFSRIRSEKALILSATKNLKSATNWLSTHETDADIDEPLFMVNIDPKDAKLVRGAPLGHKPGFIYEDDLDDTMSNIKQRAASEKATAKKKVGVIDKPLTDMTKNEKIEHIERLKAARKVQQSISDKMAKKEREEQRRRSVKEAAAAKKVCEDLAQKRAADARRREKKEDKMRRQRIKDKIAKDKQARLAAISTTMPKNSSDE